MFRNKRFPRCHAWSARIAVKEFHVHSHLRPNPKTFPHPRKIIRPQDTMLLHESVAHRVSEYVRRSLIQVRRAQPLRLRLRFCVCGRARTYSQNIVGQTSKSQLKACAREFLEEAERINGLPHGVVGTAGHIMARNGTMCFALKRGGPQLQTLRATFGEREIVHLSPFPR